MGKSILSPDMVSIGLLISEGNIDIMLEELFSKVMEYQIRNNRFFGVDEEDYRSACFFLIAFERNLLSNYTDLNEFHHLTFRQIIPEILRFTEVYMNDEGEHWCRDTDHDDEFIERYYGVNRKGYEMKMQLRNKMKKLFKRLQDNDSTNQIRIRDFMNRQGITDQILVKCSA